MRIKHRPAKLLCSTTRALIVWIQSWSWGSTSKLESQLPKEYICRCTRCIFLVDFVLWVLNRTPSGHTLYSSIDVVWIQGLSRIFECQTWVKFYYNKSVASDLMNVAVTCNIEKIEWLASTSRKCHMCYRTKCLTDWHFHQTQPQVDIPCSHWNSVSLTRLKITIFYSEPWVWNWSYLQFDFGLNWEVCSGLNQDYCNIDLQHLEW